MIALVKVSVVIPTFRRPTELAEAVRSALTQDGVSVEVIVVDDCPDGSAAQVVAQVGDDRVRYLRNPAPSNGRPAVVRNLGWTLASGDIVHFLDDDDHVPDGHYRLAAAEFDAHPAVGVVFGDIVPFGENPAQLADERRYFAGATRAARMCRHFGPRFGFSARLLCGDTVLVCGAAMIRRDRIGALGGFDPQLPIAEDVDFYGRAITRFGAFYTPRPTLHYRIGVSLAHGADVMAPTIDAYRRMQSRYRAAHGDLPFRLCQITARFLSIAA